MVPAMLRRFCFYSWYSQKKVYESIFGGKFGAQISDPQGGFRLYYNMGIAPAKDRWRSPLPCMSWFIMVPKPKKPPNLGVWRSRSPSIRTHRCNKIVGFLLEKNVVYKKNHSVICRNGLIEPFSGKLKMVFLSCLETFNFSQALNSATVRACSKIPAEWRPWYAILGDGDGFAKWDMLLFLIKLLTVSCSQLLDRDVWPRRSRCQKTKGQLWWRQANRCFDRA